MYDEKTTVDPFQTDVEAMLSGYLESEDTRKYLALKIRKLHEQYLGVKETTYE